MRITVGKILALLIAIVCAVRLTTVPGGFKGSLALLFPLVLIWFPEEIGSLTGDFKSGYVNVETPAVMVSFVGWVFLVGLPVLYYFLNPR